MKNSGNGFLEIIVKTIKNAIMGLFFCIYDTLYGNMFYDKFSVIDNTSKAEGEKDNPFAYTICYVSGLGWNALDWWMPILVWLKEHHPECKLVSLLVTPNSLDSMRQERQRYNALKMISDTVIFNAYSGESILPDRLYRALEWRMKEKYVINNPVPDLTKEVLDGIGNLNAILLGGDTELVDVVCFLKRNFPSSVIYVSPVLDFSMGWKLHSGSFPGDYFLYTDFFQQQIDVEMAEKCILVGAPRGDKWWFARRKSDLVSLHLQNRVRKHGKPVISCFIAQQRDFLHFPEAWRNAFSSFMQRHPEFFYIIKFHPRDTSEQREEFLCQKVPPNVEWEESSIDLQGLQAISDLTIIIGPSDAVVTLLFNDEIPTITFWDSYDYSANYWRPIKQGGRMLSFCEANDLVMHADNISELEQCVDAAINDNKWQEYRGRFHEYLPKISNSSKVFVDFLISRLQ